MKLTKQYTFVIKMNNTLKIKTAMYSDWLKLCYCMIQRLSTSHRQTSEAINTDDVQGFYIMFIDSIYLRSDHQKVSNNPHQTTHH